MEMPNNLLTRARAAEHVVHAIAGARIELLTPGVLRMVADAELQESSTIASWDFAGYSFAMSGAAAVIGAAAIVTAPLEAPTLLFGGAALALTHGLSALSSADDEIKRLQHAEEFRRRYGFDRSELLWNVVPPGIRYWFLQPGDGVLELALKAKRGALGLGDDPQVMGRMLRQLLAALPRSQAERAERLEDAIAKAASDMSIEPGDASLSAAWRVAAVARSGALQQPRGGGYDAAAAAPPTHFVSGVREDESESESDDEEDDVVFVEPASGGVQVASSTGTVNAAADPFPSARVRGAAPRAEAKGSEMCSICLAKRRTHALIPCGHRCLCEGCAVLENLDNTCPICRAAVYDSLRVFDP